MSSDQPSRSRVLACLAGFVVAFGIVAWLVTGELGFHGAPPSHSHPPIFSTHPEPHQLSIAHRTT